MAKIIRPRGDIKSNWEARNPILNIREIGIEWETTIGVGKVKIKFGDGVTHWNDLDYAIIPNESGFLYNTKTEWETTNPILAVNEIGIEWDEIIGVGQINVKFGDGSNHWNDLDYGISNDITNKSISTIIPPLESDENPILSSGDTVGEIVGKLNKQQDYLKTKLGYERLEDLALALGDINQKDFVSLILLLNNLKLNKSDLYDGIDSTSSVLGATANSVRQVKELIDDNVSEISLISKNLDKYYTFRGQYTSGSLGEIITSLIKNGCMCGYIFVTSGVTGLPSDYSGFVTYDSYSAVSGAIPVVLRDQNKTPRYGRIMLTAKSVDWQPNITINGNLLISPSSGGAGMIFEQNYTDNDKVRLQIDNTGLRFIRYNNGTPTTIWSK